MKNYMDIVVAIHPPDTPGHYSFEVTPDYPENQLIVDSVNPGRATFRTAVFGEFSITPKFHTTDGKVIFLAQGSIDGDETSKAITTKTFSLRVKDTCQTLVKQVDCIAEQTNKNCKNFFGIGEEINFYIHEKNPDTPSGIFALWKHSNPNAGAFLCEGDTNTDPPTPAHSCNEVTKGSPVKFNVSYTPNSDDTVTAYFFRYVDNGQVYYRFKDEYQFKVVEPNLLIPRKYKPTADECASGEQDETYCSYIGNYGEEGDITTGKSIGVDAGYYLDLEPSQACFDNIDIRENFNYGNDMGSNYCMKWNWPNNESFCFEMEASSEGTIPVTRFPGHTFYRDKAVTSIWPKELMNGVIDTFQYHVSIKIEWTEDKDAPNPVWNELGNSGFCAYFYPNGSANARRVIDKLSENDSPGNPDGPTHPCAENGNSLYYTTTSPRGPWVTQSSIPLPN